MRHSPFGDALWAIVDSGSLVASVHVCVQSKPRWASFGRLALHSILGDSPLGFCLEAQQKRPPSVVGGVATRTKCHTAVVGSFGPRAAASARAQIDSNSWRQTECGAVS